MVFFFNTLLFVCYRYLVTFSPLPDNPEDPQVMSLGPDLGCVCVWGGVEGVMLGYWCSLSVTAREKIEGFLRIFLDLEFSVLNFDMFFKFPNTETFCLFLRYSNMLVE